MDWVISGIWGDGNMPPIELLESELFGTRVSPIIDVSPAIEKLGVIRSGKIYWNDRKEPTLVKLSYGLVEMRVSVDGGLEYQQVANRGFIRGVSNTMQLRLMQLIRSPVVDILPNSAVELHQIEVVLSDKPEVEWGTSEKITLKWGDPDEGQ